MRTSCGARSDAPRRSGAVHRGLAGGDRSLVSPIILPGPFAVLRRAAADFWSAPALSYYGVEDPSLFANLLYTAENVAIAVLLGSAIGVTLGLLSARVWFVRAAIDPIMMTAGTVPILIAAPFLLIWFGVGRASAVSLVAFYVVVILYVSAQRAALNLDPIYEDSALTLGAEQRQMLRDILIPATVPEILGGFRIALAGTWGLEAVAELLGSQSGIGKVLEVLAGATDPQGILAVLLLLGLAAILADVAAAAFIARFAAWNFPPAEEPSAMPMTAIARMIEIVHLGRNYTRADGQRVNAVDDVSLIVPEGEFVCLIGPSGCGKSTLLQMVAGLDTPSSGVDRRRRQGDRWTRPRSRHGLSARQRLSLDAGRRQCRIWPQVPRRRALRRAARSRATICAESASRMSSGPGRASFRAAC